MISDCVYGISCLDGFKILWINIILNSFGSLVLGKEQPNWSIMQHTAEKENS